MPLHHKTVHVTSQKISIQELPVVSFGYSQHQHNTRGRPGTGNRAANSLIPANYHPSPGGAQVNMAQQQTTVQLTELVDPQHTSVQGSCS